MRSIDRTTNLRDMVLQFSHLLVIIWHCDCDENDTFQFSLLLLLALGSCSRMAHGTTESLTARLLAAGYGHLPGVAAWAARLLCWSSGDRPQAMMGWWWRGGRLPRSKFQAWPRPGRALCLLFLLARGQWRFRPRTAAVRPCCPGFTCHAFLRSRARGIEWRPSFCTAFSPATREVFDLMALKQWSGCAGALLRFRVDVDWNRVTHTPLLILSRPQLEPNTKWKWMQPDLFGNCKFWLLPVSLWTWGG